MSDSFNAIVAEEVDGKVRGSLKQLDLSDLPEEAVLIDVAYSSLNYKDGLAVSGKGKICRKLPMVCGIDLAGTVAESSDCRFKTGDKVLVNGYELSEKYWGGYSQKQRVNPDFLVPLPDGLTLKESMAIGTAGYTAMLAIMALQKHGVTPEQGEILVTGAAGGVGSVAIAILAELGFNVVASTGRPELHEYLKGLGASSFIDRHELSGKAAPLGAERWAGVVDSVGSNTLANAISQTKRAGCVAACGLAGGIDLPSSVFPFILRGVTLAGIDSVMAPMELRLDAWKQLASDLPKSKLADITSTEPMTRIPELAEKLIAGQIKGRIIVDVNA